MVCSNPLVEDERESSGYAPGGRLHCDGILDAGWPELTDDAWSGDWSRALGHWCVHSLSPSALQRPFG